MASNRWSSPHVEPYAIRAHHLLCAVCARGGCKSPPPGRKIIAPLLKALWAYPNLPLKLTADIDVTRAHYLDAYEARRPAKLPKDFRRRQADYVARRKDLEVLRSLGVLPNAVLPASVALGMLFRRQPTLDGICRTSAKPSKHWPRCPFAGKGYYEKIVKAGVGLNLGTQAQLGEKLDGRGVWAMIRARTRSDLQSAKARSSACIARSRRLYIRPNHMLCILCTYESPVTLVQDNLIELRDRMLADPDIPVTLTEGCCMVCDPCNIYHPQEHVCYTNHHRTPLRDLMMLERLGLAPGATLPARELYRLVYRRIKSLHDVCGWGDGKDHSGYWATCGAYRFTDAYDRARKEGWFVSSSPAKRTSRRCGKTSPAGRRRKSGKRNA